MSVQTNLTGSRSQCLQASTTPACIKQRRRTTNHGSNNPPRINLNSEYCLSGVKLAVTTTQFSSNKISRDNSSARALNIAGFSPTKVFSSSKEPPTPAFEQTPLETKKRKLGQGPSEIKVVYSNQIPQSVMRSVSTDHNVSLIVDRQNTSNEDGQVIMTTG